MIRGSDDEEEVGGSSMSDDEDEVDGTSMSDDEEEVDGTSMSDDEDEVDGTSMSDDEEEVGGTSMSDAENEVADTLTSKDECRLSAQHVDLSSDDLSRDEYGRCLCSLTTSGYWSRDVLSMHGIVLCDLTHDQSFALVIGYIILDYILVIDYIIGYCLL